MADNGSTFHQTNFRRKCELETKESTKFKPRWINVTSVSDIGEQRS